MSEAALIVLIRKISRLFYDDLSCIVIDYICKHKRVEDNAFASEYNLKPNDVRGALNRLKDDGFLRRNELNKKKIDEEIRRRVTKSTSFVEWTFSTDLMNAIKYRVMKLREAIDAKIKLCKKDLFDCKSCEKEYDAMEVYQKNYVCLICHKPLMNKPKPCKNPELLRRESNMILNGLEELIKASDDFTISREFFGFELIKRPNFNLPDNVKVHGFNNPHFSNLKLAPTVNVEFSTLKTDIYIDAKVINEEVFKKAKRAHPTLFKYFLNKTKERLSKNVKGLGKKVNKRKKKEMNKKVQEENGNYDTLYKEFMAKVIDI